MKKLYKFAYDSFNDIHLEVDRDVYTEELAKCTLGFFSWGSPYDEDGDLVVEALKKIALQCIIQATINNHNTYGVISDFNDGVEGYPKLDGTSGIVLKKVEYYEFGDDNLTIEAVEEVK